MRFLLIPFLCVLGTDFEPQAALRAMIAKIKETESSFQQKSLMIDHTLREVVDKQAPSLLQLESASQLASEMKAFEAQKSVLLEKDDKLVREKKAAFEKAMAKLTKDSNTLLRHRPSSSFIQAKPDVTKFFAAPLDQVERIHKVAASIAGESVGKKAAENESVEGLDVNLD